jgi:hypothetical protein
MRSEYGSRDPEDGGVEGDETEDLYLLLSTVKVFLICITISWKRLKD